MTRNTQKLRRLTVLAVVFAAIAIPCAGWAWDGVAGDSSDTPAASVAP